MTKIETLANLTDWLHSQQIDLSQWGEQNAKTVSDLWNELQHQETTVSVNPPMRHVRVVRVVVRQTDGTILVESAQLLNDGRIRKRWRAPSEKLHINENYVSGAIRCLVEEVRVKEEHVTLIPSTHIVQDLILESPSYPNLKTQYEFHTVDAVVAGLPSVGFCALNVRNDPSDPVLAHEWAWCTPDSIESKKTRN
ncbi:MAG: NUDIX domain-containing protein [Candidatus Promineifilaceae bacterium]